MFTCSGPLTLTIKNRSDLQISLYQNALVDQVQAIQRKKIMTPNGRTHHGCGFRSCSGSGPKFLDASTSDFVRYVSVALHPHMKQRFPVFIVGFRKQCNSTWLWRVIWRFSKPLLTRFFETTLTPASGQTLHACGHRNTWTQGQWLYIPNRCLPG